MKFAIFQRSEIGDRQNNEDSAGYCYSRDTLLMMVADGMGGHQAGERASRLAIRVLAKAFSLAAKPRLSDPAAFLAQAFIDAHFAVNEISGTGDRSPRTTLVAAVVQDGQVWHAHVGDSRLYHCRQGKVLLRTRDHSQAQMLFEQGMITEMEMRLHPGRNRLFASIGGPEIPEIEFGRRLTLQHGDVVALCTDGVWGQWEDEEIAHHLQSPNLEWATNVLVEEAVLRANGRSDNATMVAMRWLEEDAALDASTITTETLRLTDVTTLFSQREETLEGEAISDEALDRAIAEINTTIEKFRKKT